MDELFYRTEDIAPEEVLTYFVETKQDRNVVDALKAPTPVVLVGSRGVGKSFLLRVAERQLLDAFDKDRVFPVYVTFNRSSLIQTPDPERFQHWMIARLASRIMRSLRQHGHLAALPGGASILAGQQIVDIERPFKIEAIANAFESSWQQHGAEVDIQGLPSVDSFKDAIEDLCGSLRIKRFAVFIDEAAHIFLPEQQRQFFTMFRDLRSPYLTCNAAVYPGVTAFGPTFQPAHDATFLTLDREILAEGYVKNMREMVEKQADSALLANITRNGENFAILAYAASGNPRILLKTIAKAPKLNSQQINEVIREYYRTDIWAEHSALYEKYAGHKSLIDWGRKFIENHVLPDLKTKNADYHDTARSTCFFWIHRDAPQSVKEALRLLAYTGIVIEHSTGIKATRSEIGTRYAVNLGCLFSLEGTAATVAFRIAKHLTPKRMSEYGMSHPAYQGLLQEVPDFTEVDASQLLAAQLQKEIEVLDITQWQKQRLSEKGFNTIGDILRATEPRLRELHYVGQKRAKQMRNAAMAATFEYLSG